MLSGAALSGLAFSVAAFTGSQPIPRGSADLVDPLPPTRPRRMPSSTTGVYRERFADRGLESADIGLLSVCPHVD